MSRKFQLCLVLAVGFLIPFVRSLGIFLGIWDPGPATSYRFVRVIAFELVGLLFLYLVLRYQRRRFREIGLTFAVGLTELWHSFALFFAGLFSSALLYFVVNFIYVLIGHGLPRPHNSAMVFGTTLSVLPVLFVLLNPFYEELLVRAYLISETEEIYRSTALAVFLSVALQISYHLYQGLPAALSHIPTFLLFSLYFVRMRRILPVILAHMYMDVLALAVYFRHLH
jgi:membrane protease YdiL (CAAX protease family)